MIRFKYEFRLTVVNSRRYGKQVDGCVYIIHGGGRGMRVICVVSSLLFSPLSLSLYFYLYLSVLLRCSLPRRPCGKNAFYCETTSFGSSEVLPLSPWRKHKITCRQPVTYPRSSLKFSAGNLFVPLAPSFSSCFETEKFPVAELIAAKRKYLKRLFILRVGNSFDRTIHLSHVEPYRRRKISACMDHY